jgi:hypothetical protein
LAKKAANYVAGIDDPLWPKMAAAKSLKPGQSWSHHDEVLPVFDCLS